MLGVLLTDSVSSASPTGEFHSKDEGLPSKMPMNSLHGEEGGPGDESGRGGEQEADSELILWCQTLGTTTSPIALQDTEKCDCVVARDDIGECEDEILS